jgi:peptide/nickel transport system permease protein
MNGVRDIVLERLLSTLLLIGAAYLSIFVVGVPLALFLSRKYGYWQDRLFSLLAPLSSVPSWVHGTLLLFIFALELHLFPYGRMFDRTPPDTTLGYVPIVLKHMILPVTAIVLSLLFQLIYAWRTFFLVYANEDYVELAHAKGLPFRVVEKKYILRPSLPYMITSFALTLVSFWQTTTALEVVFSWPGIGKLYIDSLPHFWGSSMFPGELVIVLALVVVFAYLLGAIVLVLDVIYALTDPRVRIGMQGPTLRRVHLGRIRFIRRTGVGDIRALLGSIVGRRKGRRQPRYALKPVDLDQVKVSLSDYGATIRTGICALKSVLRELVRYRSAVVGLTIIAILVGGSIYAAIALPYNQVGRWWYTKNVSGKTYAPKLAEPEWTNWFRKDDLLSTLVLDNRHGTASKVVQPGSGETTNVTLTYSFDYPYGEVPQELFIYFVPHYDVKRPFVSMTWITPDGREIKLKDMSTSAERKVDISDLIPRKIAAFQRVANESYDTEQIGSGDPELYALFADPAQEEFVPLKGVYTLRVDGLVFEDGADLDGELVILGQVYGVAGTDYMRRDLLLPLLWGMPFALVFGLLGAVLTTAVAMIIAATGVWFGGWIDTLVQRITEANMILPVLAISVLFYALYNVSLWTILGIIVLLNVFSGPTKAFRAAFLQVRESPYVEAAQAYGASDWRIVMRYMVPRIIPVLIPQLVALIPSYVFLEATLGMFNIRSTYPTWGRVIYEALRYGPSWGSRYWVLQPIALLLLTGFAFGMIGFALDRVLNPRLREV